MSVANHSPPAKFAKGQLSASKWSSAHDTEHSIANANAEAITNAEHFVYIENQVHIQTLTSLFDHHWS